MERADFERELIRDGYEIVARTMAPNTINPDHTHDFDARVLVTEGEIVIRMNGEPRRFLPGEWCAVPAGTVHSEQCGPAGVAYVAGRRRLA